MTFENGKLFMKILFASEVQGTTALSG